MWWLLVPAVLAFAGWRFWRAGRKLDRILHEHGLTQPKDSPR